MSSMRAVTPGAAESAAVHAEPTFGRATTGKVGMWIFLITDAMTFGGLLIAYGRCHPPSSGSSSRGS